MKNPMNIYNLVFHSVKDQVVLNNEVTIPQTHQFFFVWNSSKLRVFRKKIEVLFYLCCKRVSCRLPVCSDVVDNFKKIILSCSQKANRVLKPLHVYAFEVLSLLAIEFVLYHRLPSELVQQQVC